MIYIYIDQIQFRKSKSKYNNCNKKYIIYKYIIAINKRNK